MRPAASSILTSDTFTKYLFEKSSRTFKQNPARVNVKDKKDESLITTPNLDIKEVANVVTKTETMVDAVPTEETKFEVTQEVTVTQNVICADEERTNMKKPLSTR